MGEMQAKSDTQLLREYAERGHDAAFRELVTRHADWVYSAALRQTESADLAADIAQSVFVDLARKARTVCNRLSTEASLAGWLHRGTRYAALNHLRDTHRRQTNERQAMEQLLTNAEPAADWEQIRPALDEALYSLNEADREVLLLRFFKNQDFRGVGLALGVSDDAAQKRVSRAVERLREFFAKRGVTVGAGGLAAAISANAIQAAPVGLAVAISAATTLAGSALTATTTATKALAMTAFQKTLVAATVAVLAGVGIYEAREIAALRRQVQSLERQRTQTPAAPGNDTSAALQQTISQLSTQNSSLASALAQANADKTRLETEREQAKRAAALFQELADQANARDTNPAHAYPTARHVWVAFGKMGRLAALLKEDDSRFSPEEKSALEAARTQALDELPNLLKAAKQFDAARSSGTDSQWTDVMDEVACLLYGALNLDEQQFSQVYGVMQGLQQEARQKGLSKETPASEAEEAVKQIKAQFKAEMQSFVTPEQARILAEVLTHIQLEPGRFGFNFSF